MKPKIIEFERIGESRLGFISVAEVERNIPFIIKRVFWTFYTPEDVIRGKHAHYETEMVLIAVSGIIEVDIVMKDGYTERFLLNKPGLGLYLPKLCWHTMRYSHNAVQLVFASTYYFEQDYIRNYEEFKQI